MATRQRKDPDLKLKYLVTRASDEFVIEIPASWKITFGAVNPGRSEDGYNRGGLHALRIWEGEKLRAVFCDVRGVRDLSIPMAIKIEKSVGESRYESDSIGNFDMSQSRKMLESEFEVVEDGNPF